MKQPTTRREFLAQASFGFGSFALAHLLQSDRLLGQESTRPIENLPLDVKGRSPHFAPKAKAMISLFMHGGPSHIDLFDPKPELVKHDGKIYTGDPKKIYGEFVNNPANIAGSRKYLFGSPWKFAQHGQSGTAVSELFPHTAGIVDDLCVIRSMHTGMDRHDCVRYFLNGMPTTGNRPTIGSWVVYALGSENQNLPAYMALADSRTPITAAVEGPETWSSGFMPQICQGTVARAEEPRILNLDAPVHLRGDLQRENLDFLAELNRRHLQKHPGEADLEARIASYELAASMQTAAKEALDISREPESIQKMYGIDQEVTRSYGTRCLIARRLIERGVRFVQICTTGQVWDNHSGIRGGLPRMCRVTDQPTAALVKDLKQRGLLDTTIVHWGGEMGRLPTTQGDLKNPGRDHNGQGFTIWLAGGGIKGGMTYGSTDEVGHFAVENPVTPNDYQATVLHLLGLNHERLAFLHNGREQRLIDNRPARVMHEILA